MKRFFIILTLSLSFAVQTIAQIQTGETLAVTDTESGKVRGYVNNGIYTYKGIPYGTAKRFELPQKPKPWTATRSSMSYGPVSPLTDPTTAVQDESEFVFDHNWGYPSEDCLRINVWSPGVNDGKKRPVMFWIHGGGFTAGSSQELPSYDGENLAKKGDVVVVSINHRLNILGYLDLSAHGEQFKHSANLGIIDLKFALEWVKNNIQNFGGDASNVTIFGQSGGGAKVNCLMAMPSAKGLFHKAINMSGSFRTAMLDKSQTQEIAKEVLSELKIGTDDVTKIQSVPYQTLADAGKRALKTIADKMRAAGKPVIGFGLSWGPSVDGDDLPFQLFSNEAMELSKNVPLMLGTTKNEFMSSVGRGLSFADENKIMEIIKAQYKDKADAYIAAVKKAYPVYKMPSDLMDVDAIFRPGAVSQANLKSAVKGGAPVYMYLFTWQSPVLGGKYKATHCMDIAFAFNNILRAKQMNGDSKEAFALADKVSQAYINFAKTGNPNNKKLPTWPAYNAQSTATMWLDNKCEVKPQQDKELFDLLSVSR